MSKRIGMKKEKKRVVVVGGPSVCVQLLQQSMGGCVFFFKATHYQDRQSEFIKINFKFLEQF